MTRHNMLHEKYGFEKSVVWLSDSIFPFYFWLKNKSEML